jgi:hypothetical protein
MNVRLCGTPFALSLFPLCGTFADVKEHSEKRQSLSICTTRGGLLEKSMGKKKKCSFLTNWTMGFLNAFFFSIKGFMRRHSRFSGEDHYENVQIKSWRLSVRA